ncbi:MAG: hypothetical protein NW208_14485 [Bryobacter sp.]|nr:hypothetical protein [Bryobacter sp.]
MERTPQNHNLAWALCLLGLLAFNTAIYRPMFTRQEFPYRGSIEAGYAATARFVAEHPNPWGWNPQSYAGQPTQFTYPPLLPYASALVQWLTGTSALWATRWVVVGMACLAAPLLALAFAWMTGNRVIALLLGSLFSYASPAYGFFGDVDGDRGIFYLPWRFQTFAKYGEGPHLTGLTILILALAALIWGARRKDFPSLFLMAIGLAAAPLLNWLAAFGLTICVLLLWLTNPRWIPRIFLAGLLAYALAAFWLTPDYVFTTALNWPKDAYEYKVDSRGWLLYVGLVAALLLARLLLWALRAPWEVCFTSLATLAFGWVAGGFYWFNRDTLPESRRYALEFELFLLAAAFTWLAWRWKKSKTLGRVVVVAGLLAVMGGGSAQLVKSLRRGWSDWRMMQAEQTVEYQAALAIHDHAPRGRSFVSGGTRFHFNAFFAFPQVGGTFESGLRNRIAVDYQYQMTTGEGSRPGQDTEDARRQMMVLGVGQVVTHGPASKEYYRDIRRPEKFSEFAEATLDLTAHDKLYRLPFYGFAHLVKPEEWPANRYIDTLGPLAAAIADPARPKLQWVELSPSHYRIEGSFPAGYELFVSMNDDPGWEASQAGVKLAKGKSPLGLLRLLPAPANDAAVELRFHPSLQQQAGGALSALAWVGSLFLCLLSLRKAPATARNLMSS